MKTIRLGVIGYGVRMDMLMDEFAALPVKTELVAVTDPNPSRVRELMLKNGYYFRSCITGLHPSTRTGSRCFLYR